MGQACSVCLKLCCWPPCVCCRPTELAARLSLRPPEPSYEVQSDSGPLLKMVQDHVWEHQRMVLRFVKFSFTESRNGNRIACALIETTPSATITILYAHGNGSDIGQEVGSLYELGKSVGCNVFTYDYSGYGRSSGKPSVENLYADADCALEVLQSKYDIQKDSIVLIGRSLGSVPTVELASKEDFPGVVLICPLASGLRTVCPALKTSPWFDVYRNVNKIHRVTAPVLIIHGTSDLLIDVQQGYELYRECPNPVEPLWVEGAGHNDLELAHFLHRLRKFLAREIVRPKTSWMATMRSNQHHINYMDTNDMSRDIKWIDKFSVEEDRK